LSLARAIAACGAGKMRPWKQGSLASRGAFIALTTVISVCSPLVENEMNDVMTKQKLDEVIARMEMIEKRLDDVISMLVNIERAERAVGKHHRLGHGSDE
jgi:hypothetical protein